MHTSSVTYREQLYVGIAALFLTPSLSSSKKSYIEMAISSKRPRSEQGTGDSALPLKRRSFILSNQAETPRGSEGFQFLKEADGFSLDSEDENNRTNNLIRFSTSVELNPKLVEAVGRYSDSDSAIRSDQEYHYQIGEASLRRKSLSRPGSFSSSSRKLQVSKLDLLARERCFDYIVQSIDEVWARYCDTTSSAEAVVYNSFAAKKNGAGVKIASLHNRKPLNISDNETEFDSVASENEVPSEDDDDESCGYKSEATNPTEYENETDYSESRTVSNLPDSVKLQSLKHRLTKAKSDLELVYDSRELTDSQSFWRRWDMIKYSAVEMMEDDDDDEVIETTIEELEQGRCYTN